MSKNTQDLWGLSLSAARETIKKSFVKELKWESLPIHALLDFTVRELFERRFMIEVLLDEQKVFVCSHSDDLESLQLKYPNNVTIHFSQIIEAITNGMSQDSLKNIIKVFSVFKEAKVKKKNK